MGGRSAHAHPSRDGHPGPAVPAHPAVVRPTPAGPGRPAPARDPGPARPRPRAAPPPAAVPVEPSIGSPLTPRLRRRMERLVGFDPGAVRIHTGEAAARAAAALGAAAFTVGPDVYFGAGRFDPASDAGRRLLAHELVHVGQQPAGRPFRAEELTPDRQASLEAAARAGHGPALAPAAPPPLALVHGATVAVPLRAPQEDAAAETPPAEAPTPAAPGPLPDPGALLAEIERRLRHRLRIERERSGVQRWT
jgi:Domain of unknown function (DUF4157)